jgi:hypothetical protein
MISGYENLARATQRSTPTAVTVLGKKIQKYLVAGGVVGDMPFGQELAAVVDEGDCQCSRRIEHALLPQI